MDDATIGELREASRPIASLIGKSEKALKKLTPGTSHHTMLRKNIEALYIASVLMNEEIGEKDRFSRDDLQKALDAFGAMIRKSENAQIKFSPGTSQHSLLRNRLKALRIAEALTTRALDRCGGRHR